MLIDDEPVANLLHQKILEKSQLANQIIVYQDPEKALLELQTRIEKKSCPSLVLLDLNMPRLSGWDFLECLKSMFKNKAFENKLKICILTSSMDREDEKRAKIYHFVIGYLHKPFSQEKCQELLKKLMKHENLQN